MTEIRLEDLFIACDECGGTGEIDERVARERAKAAGVARFEWGTCKKCGGAGGRLTESGRALKQFMDRLQRGRL